MGSLGIDMGMNFLSSALMLEPFDPAKHRPQDIGLGGLSTEYIITEEAPDGGFWNIPSVWFDRSGAARLLNSDAAWQMALDYESATGRKFPRFDSASVGSERAMHRSAGGGASRNMLAQYGGKAGY